MRLYGVVKEVMPTSTADLFIHQLNLTSDVLILSRVPNKEERSPTQRCREVDAKHLLARISSIVFGRKNERIRCCEITVKLDERNLIVELSPICPRSNSNKLNSAPSKGLFEKVF